MHVNKTNKLCIKNRKNDLHFEIERVEIIR